MALTVGDIMETDPQTVAPGDDVETVVGVLRENELPGVPVVNEGGRVVGIVTENDLIFPGDDGDLHLPHYINVFGGTVFLEPFKHFEERVKKAFATSAEDMMTADPTTVGRDTPVDEAARIVHDTGHNRLPVVEHGRLVGVVTRLDLLGGLVQG